MIKSYLELNKNEKQALVEFLNKNNNNVTLENIEKEYKAEEFDYGKGVLISIKEKNIIGKLSIVLLECYLKNVAYIVRFEIDEKFKYNKEAILELKNEAIKLANSYGAFKIYLGTKNNEIINTLNLQKQYSAVKMILQDRKIKLSPFKLEKLTEENKNEYIKINNDAFYAVPNGGTLTKYKVNEYIKETNENNYYFIAKLNDVNIGFVQFHIENGVGEFDLGLIKIMQGKGYGKKLLETAIYFLNLKEVNDICLTVITKNKVAYEMYKKRGFIEIEILNDWFEL
jgi:GNAT superfamily N-acetyltransferase